MQFEADDLRRAIQVMKDGVAVQAGDDGRCAVAFPAPDLEGLVSAGVPAEIAAAIVDAPWFAEMVEAVVETPDFCDDGDPPEVVLGFARDTIHEYVAKRFS
jgi:hypothetical protein